MAGKMLGLDIGSGLLKIASWNGDRITKLVSSKVPEGLTDGDDILDYDLMAQFIKDTIKNNGLSGGDCSVVLPARHTFLRDLALPAMTAEQLQVNLPYEFRDFIEGRKDDYFFDYSVDSIVKDEEGKATEINLSCAAVPKDVIINYRQLCRKAGLTMAAAIPAESAFGNLLAHKGVVDEEESCFIDLGLRTTRVEIFRGREFKTSKIADMGVGEGDARRSAIPPEIRKTLNFYRFSNRESEIPEVYFSGGGSYDDELLAEISDAAEVRLRSIEELLPEGCEEYEHKNLFLIAIGAALHDARIVSEKKNQLPGKAQFNLALKEANPLYNGKTAALLALILVLAALFGKFCVADRFGEMYALRSRLDQLELEKAALARETADYAEVAEEYSRYSVGWMTDAEKALVAQTEAFKVINDVVGGRAKIYMISSVDNRLTLQLSGLSLKDAAALADALRALPEISGVDMNYTDTEEQLLAITAVLQFPDVQANGGAN